MTFSKRLLIPIACTGLWAQEAPAPVGIFEGQADVGTVLHAGSGDYDAASKTYTLTGSGDNMWAAEDDFHFVWKKVTGDVTLTADIAFASTTGNAHEKGALMIRRTLDKDSDYVDAALHLVGLTSLQSRDQKGATTREVQSYIPSPKRMRLVKRGDYVFMLVAGDDGVFHLSGGSMKLALNEPFYVGLAVCAHDKDAVGKVTFSNVELATGPGAAPGKATLYSSLEAVPVQSTDRRTVYVEQGRMESPNWSKDGKTLIVDSNGHLQRILAAGGKPEAIDTGKIAHIGSHHGLSPDGTTLALTDESGKGKALIYTVPVGGGVPVQVTKQSPGYWRDWSPDGKTILFTGTRKGKPGIFTIPATGGAETMLSAAGENPVYSPDGKFVYFNSDRGGSMQVWRMLADGTAPEQITNDDFVNWMPHVSPDGTQVAFLSCDAGAAGAADKDVKVRTMILSSKMIKVISNLFGGAGTFDAAPWSPDGKILSYVSYQMLPQ